MHCPLQVRARLLDASAYPWPAWLPRGAHGDDVWIFVSRTEHVTGEARANVAGRLRHHDFVQAPFSWHWQIRGSKHWQLWPPGSCAEHCAPREVSVECGEMLFIDTDLWEHATSTHAPSDVTSISVALEAGRAAWWNMSY